jgi:hypothetical protein
VFPHVVRFRIALGGCMLENSTKNVTKRRPSIHLHHLHVNNETAANNNNNSIIIIIH